MDKSITEAVESATEGLNKACVAAETEELEQDVASDLVQDEEMKRMLGVSIAIPRLLKQGLGVREISGLLNVPHGMIVDVAKEIGHKPTQVNSISSTKVKKARKAQRKARKVNKA